MEENIRMSFTYILNWLQEDYKEMFIESVKWIRHLNFWSPRWNYLEPDLTFSNSTFCPLRVFLCFVWISEQTAIISLYNINWLVFVTERECLLRGTDWVFIYNSDQWLLYVPPVSH